MLNSARGASGRPGNHCSSAAPSPFRRLGRPSETGQARRSPSGKPSTAHPAAASAPRPSAHSIHAMAWAPDRVCRTRDGPSARMRRSPRPRCDWWARRRFFHHAPQSEERGVGSHRRSGYLVRQGEYLNGAGPGESIHGVGLDGPRSEVSIWRGCGQSITIGR